MELLRTIAIIIWPYKSVPIYRTYFDTAESIVLCNDRPLRVRIYCMVLCLLYFTGLNIAFLLLPNTSLQNRLMLADTMLVIMFNRILHWFYVFQSALIAYPQNPKKTTVLFSAHAKRQFLDSHAKTIIARASGFFALVLQNSQKYSYTNQILIRGPLPPEPGRLCGAKC